MNRMILALAMGSGVALYAAAPAAADEPKPATATTPVVVSGTTDVISTAPAARRGLFGRLRDRRTGTAMTTTTVPTTGTIVTPTTTTPGTTLPTPVPMPMTKPAIVIPASATKIAVPMVTTAAYSTPARTGLFSRARTRATPTATPATMTAPMPLPLNAVVPASGTVTMASPMMDATTTTARMGLIARMRARR